MSDDPVRLAIAGVLATAGLVLVIGGALGVVRFGDLQMRLHGWRAAMAGAPLVLAAVAVERSSTALSLRLLLLGAVLAAIGPALAPLIAHADHRPREPQP